MFSTYKNPNTESNRKQYVTNIYKASKLVFIWRLIINIYNPINIINSNTLYFVFVLIIEKKYITQYSILTQIQSNRKHKRTRLRLHLAPKQ